MAYDATDFVAEAPITTERANMIRLRDFLRTLPPRKFDMGDSGELEDADHGECGSPSCIGGWARAIFRVRTFSIVEVGPTLGLSPTEATSLFYPGSCEINDLMSDGMSPYSATPSRAANVLDNYLATGQIDWSVA